MGTNYYHHEKLPCACCGRDFERVHIGKSSFGWVFGLHVDPDLGINDLDDWKKRLEHGQIVDEYGDAHTVEHMLAIITERRGKEGGWSEVPYGYGSWTRFHEMNQSLEGPHGLLRRRLGEHCVKHGDGTWDCVVGEFS